MLSIRRFNPIFEEYAAIVAINHALWPDERQFAVELWQEEDKEWPQSALHQRFIAEYNGQIIGMGVCYEKYWQPQLGTVHIDFQLMPDYENPENCELFFNAIQDFLRKCTSPPQRIATEAREDRPARIQFLQQHGFQPSMRSPRAALQLTNFNRNLFDGLFGSVATKGIDIITLADLVDKEPDWKTKLFDLRWAIVQDVPSVEPPIRPTMAEFEEMILEDPALDKEAWFLAVDRTKKRDFGSGLLVGMSNLWINDPDRKRLDTGLTGVIRPYRRQGIATVLKVCTIEFAQKLGAITIETSNEENNPMYVLNLKLGFLPKAAWVSYRKEFP
jgi:GNAT superfamily N-acetyltransferase